MLAVDNGFFLWRFSAYYTYFTALLNCKTAEQRKIGGI